METPILNRNGFTTQVFNFQQWWDNTGQHASTLGVAVPVAIKVLVNSNQVVTPWPSGATSMTLPAGVNLENIHVMFRGSLDERSLYVANNRFSPKDTVSMFALDPLFPPANQAAYSGIVLRLNTSLGQGNVRTVAMYPGASALRLSVQTECEKTNNIVLNEKLQLRDADGFLNNRSYTLNFTKPCAPPPPIS